MLEAVGNLPAFSVLGGLCLLAGILLLFVGPSPPQVSRKLSIILWLALLIFSITGVGMVSRSFVMLPEHTFVAFYDLALHAVFMITLYAIIYSYLGIIENSVETRSPWSCLYFSIVTWTMVGYGDFVPSPIGRMFAASEALYGYVFMGLYVSLVFSGFSKSN